MEEWIHMFLKEEISKIKDESVCSAVINAAVEDLKENLYIQGKWYADYVRIRMRAVKI